MYDDLFAIIDIPLLAAGSMGGLVHAFRVKKATPWERVGYVLVGGIAANFIAPQVLRMMALVPSGFIAFGIGMSGERICFCIEKIFSSVFGKIRNE